jgi:hypothetical protein
MSFSVESKMVLPRATPALLIKTVGLPRVERMDEAAEAIASGEVRSHLKKRTDDGAGKRQYKLILFHPFIAATDGCRHTFIRQVLHVHHSNLDALLGQ